MTAAVGGPDRIRGIARGRDHDRHRSRVDRATRTHPPASSALGARIGALGRPRADRVRPLRRPQVRSQHRDARLVAVPLRASRSSEPRIRARARFCSPGSQRHHRGLRSGHAPCNAAHRRRHRASRATSGLTRGRTRQAGAAPGAPPRPAAIVSAAPIGPTAAAAIAASTIHVACGPRPRSGDERRRNDSQRINGNGT